MGSLARVPGMVRGWVLLGLKFGCPAGTTNPTTQTGSCRVRGNLANHSQHDRKPIQNSQEIVNSRRRGSRRRSHVRRVVVVVVVEVAVAVAVALVVVVVYW